MIIPALDLINNQIVRLYQGDYEHVTKYSHCPIEQFASYCAQGAKWLHLVDLTGAKNTNERQLPLLKKVIKATPAQIQIGGGIRTEDDIIELLNAGASRIVIGSTAVNEPEKVKSWITKYGADKIILALDINITPHGERLLAISGWQKNSTLKIETLLNYFETANLQHVLCTDISRDGTLNGSNVELYQDLCSRFHNIEFQSSGGIGSLEDISKLKKTNVTSVIVGRALLENKFSLKEAITCWQNA